MNATLECCIFSIYNVSVVAIAVVTVRVIVQTEDGNLTLGCFFYFTSVSLITVVVYTVIV